MDGNENDWMLLGSLIPDVIGKSLSGAAEFKVGGKKHVKFDGRISLVPIR